MSNRNEILKELRELAPTLALLDKTNPYKVPEGYFTQFKAGMLQQVTLGDAKAELNAIAPELAKISKHLAAEMPANYFSTFSGSLVKKIQAAEVQNELLEIAPELAKLQKANAYTVPAGYFTSFAGAVLSQVQEEEKPQQSLSNSPLVIIENALGRLFAPLLKPQYSVAFAGFATLLIVGALFFVKPEQIENIAQAQPCAETDVECRLALLSNEDISAYLNSHPDFNSDQIFDETSTMSADEVSDFNVYKNALKDVDDASLSEAIMD